MKIGKKFNKLSKSEYKHYIDNHKKYIDFNTLGLYRSIIENERLELEDKIEIRDYANSIFIKTFNFYQLKDPVTYFELTTLGINLTKGDTDKRWEDIKRNQQSILQEKRIKHRNFGDYSKHNCGYEDCQLNGLMIRQGSNFGEMHMRFKTDRNQYHRELKSERYKKERKSMHKIIKDELQKE